MNGRPWNTNKIFVVTLAASSDQVAFFSNVTSPGVCLKSICQERVHLRVLARPGVGIIPIVGLISPRSCGAYRYIFEATVSGIVRIIHSQF